MSPNNTEVTNSKTEKYNTGLGHQWWDSLEPQWRKAFREIGMYADGSDSIDEQLKDLTEIRVLRLAGPEAPFPNLSFELTNLSGLRDLHQLQTLIVFDHQIADLKEISNLTALTALFLNNNQIQSLEGVESLTLLESLYVQNNKIRDLWPLRGLKNLKEVYVRDNELTTLEGLREYHSDTLKTFVCLPNEKLPQREIIRVENQLGIRCR